MEAVEKICVEKEPQWTQHGTEISPNRAYTSLIADVREAIMGKFAKEPYKSEGFEKMKAERDQLLQQRFASRQRMRVGCYALAEQIFIASLTLLTKNFSRPLRSCLVLA